MDVTEIPIDALRGRYDELADAAEDIAAILDAVAANQLDVTPLFERWLVEQLERVELALAVRA